MLNKLWYINTMEDIQQQTHTTHDHLDNSWRIMPKEKTLLSYKLSPLIYTSLKRQKDKSGSTHTSDGLEQKAGENRLSYKRALRRIVSQERSGA